MARYFVTDAPVAIPEFDPSEVISNTPPNVIYIKPKMDYATKAKTTSELFTLDKESQIELHAGSSQMALLVHNIVKWEGPDLGGVPCTEENIRKMDPTEPHLEKVLEEIAKRNKVPNDRKASASTSAGAPPSRENVSLALATGTPRSTLQSAINGRLKSSDDLTPIS